jgi:hypothetical protein
MDKAVDVATASPTQQQVGKLDPIAQPPLNNDEDHSAPDASVQVGQLRKFSQSTLIQTADS